MRNILLVTNFDDTVAQTSIPNTTNLNIGIVYRIAVHQVFGDRGDRLFQALGGYRNRSPWQIVQELVTEDPHLLRQLTEERARLNEASRAHRISPRLRSGDYPPHWNEVERYTEEMADFFKDYLEGQLAHFDRSKHAPETFWPQPSKGFANFWRNLGNLAENLDVGITTAIISSNHAHFIRATFDLWGFPYPDILVTDDQLRRRITPSDVAKRFKPSPFPLLLACQVWQGKHELEEELTLDLLTPHRQNIICCGDDFWMEGKMAKCCNIPFLRFVPRKERRFAPPQHTQPLTRDTFDNWGTFPILLEWYLLHNTFQSR